MTTRLFFFFFTLLISKHPYQGHKNTINSPHSYFAQIFLVRKKNKDTNKTSWMPNIILFISPCCYPLYHVMAKLDSRPPKQGFHTSGYHQNLCNYHVPQLPKPASNCKTFCCTRVKTLINMTTLRRKNRNICPKSQTSGRQPDKRVQLKT